LPVGIYDRYGREEDITVSLSKKDVAALIGTTQESLSRLIHRWQGEELMSWKGRRIRLKRGFWEERTESHER